MIPTRRRNKIEGAADRNCSFPSSVGTGYRLLPAGFNTPDQHYTYDQQPSRLLQEPYSI